MTSLLWDLFRHFKLTIVPYKSLYGSLHSNPRQQSSMTLTEPQSSSLNRLKPPSYRSGLCGLKINLFSQAVFSCSSSLRFGFITISFFQLSNRFNVENWIQRKIIFLKNYDRRRITFILFRKKNIRFFDWNSFSCWSDTLLQDPTLSLSSLTHSHFISLFPFLSVSLSFSAFISLACQDSLSFSLSLFVHLFSSF